MNIYDELENLKAQARLNPALAQALLDTRTVSNPVTAALRRKTDVHFRQWTLYLQGRILMRRCGVPRMVEGKILHCCRGKMICMRCFWWNYCSV